MFSQEVALALSPLKFLEAPSQSSMGQEEDMGVGKGVGRGGGGGGGGRTGG